MMLIKEERVLVRPEDIKPSSKYFQVVGTFNPGAARLPNNDIVLYVRVAEKLLKDENKNSYFAPRCEGKEKCKIVFDRFKKEEAESKSKVDIVFKDGTKRLLFISHFRKIILEPTGFKIKSIDKQPTFGGNVKEGELGVEDPRITKINDEYFMTYVALSKQGNISTYLANSKDCLNWKRRGVIFSEQNKDVAVFPEKIKGRYLAFNRPEGNFEFSPPHIWISSSKDLQFWGKSFPIKLSEKNKWDYARVGAGPPPIKTDKGWLLIYHGVTKKKPKNNFINQIKKLFIKQKKQSIYSAGAALFNLNNPKRLIAKTQHPIITPRHKYEKIGYVNNVVFPTGLILDKDNKHLLIFSGGADTVVTVKKISIKDIMKTLVRVKSHEH